MDITRILAAAAFAATAHGEQKRKYTGAPYITHPLEVAALVAGAGGHEDMIIATILHDVVEDTPVQLEEIAARFGPNVAKLVDELTDKHKPSTLPGINRAVRKQRELERLRGVSREAKLIKLMDLRHNRKDIEERDPSFAVLYVKESDALQAALLEDFIIR